MTIKDCIDMVDNIKPNQYTIKDKVMWLSFIEGVIINDVLKTHEGYDEKYDDFSGYSEDKLSVPLIVSSPYDRLYTAYLKMKIDEENGETARYNNSAAMFNSYMDEFKKYYNKTHMPLNITDKATIKTTNKPSVGLSEAEFENLKRELAYLLIDHFGNSIADCTNEINALKSAVNKLRTKSLIRTVTVALRASMWEKDGDRYSQVISLDDITPYSKVDLQPSAEQLTIFYQKDIAFVTENDNCVVKVFCIGQKPMYDYVMQATITEVVNNE